MTRVHVSDREWLAVLLADLRDHPELVVEAIDGETIEAAVLGSYDLEAMRLAIYLRIRAWEAGQRAQGRDVHVELV
jgi:hypothetical protein